MANLSKRYTNHCIRATTIPELDRNGKEARLLVRASGHKSEMSKRSHSRCLCDQNQQGISNKLAKALQNKPNVTYKQTTAELQSIQRAVSVFDNSELDFLDENFRDENVFIEVDNIEKENCPPNIQPCGNGKQNVTLESGNNAVQPVITRTSVANRCSLYQHSQIETTFAYVLTKS